MNLFFMLLMLTAPPADEVDRAAARARLLSARVAARRLHGKPLTDTTVKAAQVELAKASKDMREKDTKADESRTAATAQRQTKKVKVKP